MIGTPLDGKVFVAPQITAADIPALKGAGVNTVICNRPDIEVAPGMSSGAIAAAAEAEGLNWVNNPLSPGVLSIEVIDAQRDAITASDGPVLSYCASGTRSAYLWAFAMASDDAMATKEILGALDRAGYPAPMLGPQLDRVRPG